MALKWDMSASNWEAARNRQKVTEGIKENWKNVGTALGEGAIGLHKALGPRQKNYRKYVSQLEAKNAGLPEDEQKQTLSYDAYTMKNEPMHQAQKLKKKYGEKAGINEAYNKFIAQQKKTKLLPGTKSSYIEHEYDDSGNVIGTKAKEGAFQKWSETDEAKGLIKSYKEDKKLKFKTKLRNVTGLSALDKAWHNLREKRQIKKHEKGLKKQGEYAAAYEVSEDPLITGPGVSEETDPSALAGSSYEGEDIAYTPPAKSRTPLTDLQSRMYQAPPQNTLPYKGEENNRLSTIVNLINQAKQNQAKIADPTAAGYGPGSPVYGGSQRSTMFDTRQEELPEANTNWFTGGYNPPRRVQ